MKLTVHPSQRLHGEIGDELPGDKSISHRAALFAAMASGTSRMEHFQVSGVTRPMLQGLSALGVDWQLKGETLTVHGKGMQAWQAPKQPIHCGNSATTLRLLAGAIAASGLPAVLDGSEGLRKRPMNRIVDPLRAMGVRIETAEGGVAPLRLHPRSQSQKLESLQYTLPVASAQVKSCLILAALGAFGKSVIREPGPSRDHTERMLSSMGVPITTREEASGFIVEITPPDPLVLSPLHLTLPADPSAAAFLIVAALITPHTEIRIKGICLNPTRTGLLDALRSMGADIAIQNERMAAGEPLGDLVVRSSTLHGTQISGTLVVRMIDEFPILVVAAAVAGGITTVSDAAELRLKESDRIAMLAVELKKLGVEISEQPDGFTVQGGMIKGGEVLSHGDHRLAMSLAVAGLAAHSPVCVHDAECTGESFPRFAEILQSLGAQIEIEE
jgi:3-phosphoshikimate 1-carboxyvinyltransferase